MDRVDYGHAPQDLVTLLEEMRSRVSSEKRLILIKLLARTVETDGNAEEKELASIIDALVTAYFRTKYPE